MGRHSIPIRLRDKDLAQESSGALTGRKPIPVTFQDGRSGDDAMTAEGSTLVVAGKPDEVRAGRAGWSGRLLAAVSAYGQERRDRQVACQMDARLRHDAGLTRYALLLRFGELP
jgi:hypothetical protein